MTYERDNIKAMTGYTPGEQPTDTKTIKLNTNENPFPPSPNVQHAVSQYDVASLRTYPSPTANPLRDALATLHQVAREQIVITNGGDEALRLAMTTFVEPGAVFGTATPSYSLYSVLADIQDAAIYPISLTDSFAYPDDFAERLNATNAQLTCIVNPHAPSGELLSATAISTLASAINGVLLVDEAYVDFVDPDLQYDALPLINQHNNLLFLRTFSKGYSLAGLRLGYLIGSRSLIEPILTKTRDSYNIDALSQVMGLAAITDQNYARKTWDNVRAQRQHLSQELAQLGFVLTDSQTNFLLAQTTGRHPLTAQHTYEALKQRGILVRYFNLPMMRDKLRITVGTEAQNDQLLTALRELLT